MDRSLWAPRLYQVASRKIREQFNEVICEFDIDPYANAFTRCVVCNVESESVPREAVEGEVPPKAYLRHDRYRRCPVCRRVYWSGAHTTRTLEFFESATGRPRPDLA
jgi:hypothetical protein